MAVANTLEIEDLAEVVVVAVRDVDQVGLDESLGWRWADLEGFEESFDLEKASVYTLDEACRGWSGEERCEATLQR